MLNNQNQQSMKLSYLKNQYVLVYIEKKFLNHEFVLCHIEEGNEHEKHIPIIARVDETYYDGDVLELRMQVFGKQRLLTLRDIDTSYLQIKTIEDVIEYYQNQHIYISTAPYIPMGYNHFAGWRSLVTFYKEDEWITEELGCYFEWANAFKVCNDFINDNIVYQILIKN